MLKCPQCQAEMAVKATRSPGNIKHRWLEDFARRYPELSVRRRECPVHGTMLTVELPLSHLQAVAEVTCTS